MTAVTGTETILVVEDEEVLRNLARRILQLSGYMVLTASSGEEALQLLERHDGPVHLLLTDVVMPGMSGRDLAARLANSRAGLEVLYTSGYTDDVVLRHGLRSRASSSAVSALMPRLPRTISFRRLSRSRAASPLPLCD